jgi:hypothetical protein
MTAQLPRSLERILVARARLGGVGEERQPGVCGEVQPVDVQVEVADGGMVEVLDAGVVEADVVEAQRVRNVALWVASSPHDRRLDESQQRAPASSMRSRPPPTIAPTCSLPARATRSSSFRSRVAVGADRRAARARGGRAYADCRQQCAMDSQRRAGSGALKVLRRYRRMPNDADRCWRLQMRLRAAFAGTLALRGESASVAGLPW